MCVYEYEYEYEYIFIYIYNIGQVFFTYTVHKQWLSAFDARPAEPPPTLNY